VIGEAYLVLSYLGNGSCQRCWFACARNSNHSDIKNSQHMWTFGTRTIFFTCTPIYSADSEAVIISCMVLTEIYIIDKLTFACAPFDEKMLHICIIL